MDHTENFFESNGTRLYRQSWRPDNPRAVVAAIHGLGSHSGGLKHIVDYLVPRGYVIHAFDIRGHGKSEGPQAFVNKSTDFLDDAARFLEIIQAEEPTLPLFLLGHSMGGLVSLDIAMNKPEAIKGVIAIAPALIVNEFRAALQQIPKEVPDEYTIESDPDYPLLTRDTQVIKWMDADSLRHNVITVGLMRVGLSRIEWILNHPECLHTPLLIIQGASDTIVSAKTNQEFFNSVSISDKTWLEYPEMLHNPHDEIGREDVLCNISSWLDRRVIANG
ncbi:lysophospholipase [Aneurinibacillus sp. Ricciae_BoGa-3]|uniref:alpha/beta hydrolase n=1 Tax=Aneurinibacillus sp. Ricciae_BoGa-3 TaxID=3022697 RepID=UPI0023409E6D|nr:alpha/beta hydrolase [Aneurinibacillus sp. Ricciae_BoGa-3]WCK54221.1 lysophospholipase [Aneurinibacillus sp. Ricciae_BoGa-3]